MSIDRTRYDYEYHTQIVRLKRLRVGDIVGLTLPGFKTPKYYRLVSTQNDIAAWLVEVKRVNGKYIQPTLEIHTVDWETKGFRI